jgi:hypothetical protein
MRGSKQDLPTTVTLPDGSAIRQADWGGITAELGSFVGEADPAPFFKGLPDDRCQCPHWGYVIKGQLRFHFADREEIFNAGDVYHVGPGHLPVIGENTEYVEFSPADLLAQTMDVVGRNFEAFQAASR